MVRSEKFLKHTWSKNNDSNGGAMKQAINCIQRDEVVVHLHTKKYGRAWTTMKPNELLKISTKNYGIYEVLHTYPKKVYFDIDKTERQPTEYLDKIESIILGVFPGAEFAVSGSITDKKTSYHIVLNNYLIYNNSQLVDLKFINKYFETIDDGFDSKVYTINRNMKTINQSKVDDDRIQEIIENEDMKKHFITCFFGEENKPVPKIPELSYEIQEEAMIEKSKSLFDLSVLPKLNKPCPDDMIYDQLTADQILSLLPLNEKCEHEYTHLVARFCFHQNVTFEAFLSWLQAKNKDIGSVSEKWKRHWDNLHKFPEVHMGKIQHVLSYFYPDFKRDRHFRAFKQAFKFEKKHLIKIDAITQAEYTMSGKYVIFNTGMGSGKTHQTSKYLAKSNTPYIFISPNKALALNTHQRLLQDGICNNHYLDFSTKQKKAGCLEKVDQLMIVLNSLHYLGDDKTFDTVVIDEVEMVLDLWLDPHFMGPTKFKSFEIFKNILRKAKKVILLDAFTTKKTVDFFQMLEPTQKITIFERKKEPSTRTIKYINEPQTMIKNLIEDLKNGLKCFIYYPYKKTQEHLGLSSMADFHMMLEAEGNCKGVFYNADIDEAKKNDLKDVNESWGGYNFVICNSCITCGVNYENEDFDNEYLFVSGFTQPRQIIQFSYRPRHLKSNNIYLCYLGRMQQAGAHTVDSCDNAQCPIYQQLVKNTLIEKNAPIRKSVPLFAAKAKYIQVSTDFKIEEKVKKQIDEMVKEYSIGFDYSGVKDITAIEEEELQQKMFSGEATMIDKFELQKHHFKKQFNFEEKPEYVENKLAEAWRDQYIILFDKLKIAIDEGENNLFYKIKEFNELDSIFPVDVRKTELNDDIKDQIFKEFKFRFLNKYSNKDAILKEIYNVFFGTAVITTEQDKSRNISYDIDESLAEWYHFVKEHRKPWEEMDKTCMITDEDDESLNQQIEVQNVHNQIAELEIIAKDKVETDIATIITFKQIQKQDIKYCFNMRLYINRDPISRSKYAEINTDMGSSEFQLYYPFYVAWSKVLVNRFCKLIRNYKQKNSKFWVKN